MAIKENKGVVLVELLIVMTIITTAFAYLLGLAAFSFEKTAQQEDYLRAVFLAQETMEGVRAFRDGTDWTSGLGVVSNGIDYHVEYSVDWDLVGGEEIIGDFTRKVVFSQVLRDGNDNIVEDFGTADPNSKRAVVYVSWGSSQIELVSLFTRWQ